MLNESTAEVAVVSRPDEPAPSSPSHVLHQLADFLDGVPELPELYITISDNRHVGLQLPSYEPAVPGVRFPAVARLAHAMGADTHLIPWGCGSWCFEASGTVGDLRVNVYAPITDVDAAPASSAEPERV
ncbi:hypothetical protein [Streptomyces sp. NPDC005485]|uniref:hypothetical protein n=1 Tax=Streptomyces sp. NPDC005485 TaxID=3155591 RepID=UPI0033BD51B7